MVKAHAVIAVLSIGLLGHNPAWSDTGLDLPHDMADADFSGVSLVGANPTGADLSGANLTNASFYSSRPAGWGRCDTSAGFTQDCASAAGAKLRGPDLGPAVFL
ncbi:MAG: pentapeptide repeat-containing protein [Gammaproteobacteria bacterium]|jgi:uncharacterized protein YjbI with pentapeptide repeats|nr:pentapeptide repeat-containing protein [Gammaproteobacteria bacterium]